MLSHPVVEYGFHFPWNRTGGSQEKQTQEAGDYLQFITLQDRTPERSPINGPEVVRCGQKTALRDWECSYPIGIVVDLDVGILVHGGERHPMLQLISQDSPVHHMVSEGIEQLDVDIAHQRV